MSRAHFLRCHLGVIAVLDACRSTGMRVRVRDGGDYWRSRRIEKLVLRLNAMNGIVAAITGAFKDAVEEAGGGVGIVHSPVLGRPDFERLEAEGQALLARGARRRRKRK